MEKDDAKVAGSSESTATADADDAPTTPTSAPAGDPPPTSVPHSSIDPGNAHSLLLCAYSEIGLNCLSATSTHLLLSSSSTAEDCSVDVKGVICILVW